MNKNIKKLGIAVLIIAVGFFVYNYFIKSDTPSVNTSSGSITSSVVPAGATGVNTTSVNEFSSILSSITNINIDTSILSDPTYKALRDYPIVLGTEDMGRANPFAPIGMESGAPMQTNVSVQLLPVSKITKTSAEVGLSLTLSGSGMPASVMFEYGIGEEFTNTTNPMSMTTSGSNVVVLENLTPNTSYSVRAIAVQGSSTVLSTIMNFNTLP